MTKLLTVSLTLFLLCAAANAERYDVYLLAGQSNMDGRGQSSDLTEAQLGPIKDAIIFYRNMLRSSDGWKPLTPGFSVPPKFKGELPSPTFGPEMGFVHTMLHLPQETEHPARKLAIIKGSKGGTSLRVDWNPGTKDDPESQGPRYRDFMETIQLAKVERAQNGDEMTIRGLLWHQGESDSKASFDLHQQRLKELISRLREDTGVADLPIVLGQVYDNGKRDSVRRAIRSVSEQSHRVGLVSAQGLTTWDEGTHFDALSQWEMGKRFCDEMVRIQTDSISTHTPKVVCFGDSITNRGYPRILGEMLGAETINAGVGGNSTRDALRRLQKDVVEQKPDVTVVFFGTNDMRIDNSRKHVPTNEYRDNLIRIIAVCRDVGSEIVLCTLPPIDPVPYFTRHSQEDFDSAGGLGQLIDEYQIAARQVATENNVPLVDLQESLKSTPNWLSKDGVHPTEVGNQIIADHIAKAVKQLLPANRQEASSTE